MILFTLVLDYAGGTYVSQVSSDSVDALPPMLDRAIDWGAIAGRISEEERKEFLQDVRDIAPTVVEGMSKVWCISAELAGSLAVLHAVETAAAKQPDPG